MQDGDAPCAAEDRVSDSATPQPRVIDGRLPFPVPWRLSAYYAAVFLAVGLFTPYWPLWLESRGLGPREIGVILALTTWAKVLASPVAAGIADRIGRRRPVMIVLSVCAAAVFCAYAAADTFAMAAVAAVALGLCFPPLMPVGENLAMLAARARRFDYGRVRLWGALTFIAGAWGGGVFIDDGDPRAVPVMTVGAAILVALACAALPDVRAAPSRGSFTGIGTLLRRPPFLVFVATASLIQCSHAAYYAFATLHWHAAGLGTFAIGALWAWGVAAEVVLFAISGRAVRRAGIVPLFALAAVAGVVRWTVIGVTSDPVALIVAQALHAATFGASHLAAMHFIQRTVPAAWSATAQGIYSGLATGATMALATMAAGALYAASPAVAFLAMAAMCALGGASALFLGRLYRAAA